MSAALTFSSLLSAPVQLNAAERSRPEPVLSVSFEQRNANDQSDWGHHGTIVGQPEYAEGPEGLALHLVNSETMADPAEQFINFGHPDHLQPGEGSFTVMFWYRCAQSSVSEGTILCNGYNPGDAQQGFQIEDEDVGISVSI